ncbi:DUF6064 family protein [Thalassotalea atypica]|uniref:DUF6064 family protein n=1 Tax=Thalassotalea atypica TaxID=2054316 RepID=UPI002572BEF0|nr:DUF6064 family protein [Thalassotalea atypica]
MMTEWFSYSLEDFLLFSPEVYWRLIQQHSVNFGAIAIVIEVIAIIAFYYLKHNHKRQIVITILIGAWCSVGWFFFIKQYAAINTFAQYLGYACLIQSLFLLISLLKERTSIQQVSLTMSVDTWSRLQNNVTLICLSSVIIFPVLAALLGFNWGTGVIGILPLPTITISLISVLLFKSRMRLFLLPIPTILLVIELLTLKVLLNA